MIADRDLCSCCDCAASLSALRGSTLTATDVFLSVASWGDPSRILTITRVRELERDFADRNGLYLPDDDSGWDDFVIMANHLAHFGGSTVRIVARIVEWTSTCAPTFPTDKVTARAKLIAANPCKWTADKLAWRLGLTMERRTMLKIKTIGAIDVKREDRPAWLAAHHRQRKGAERRAAGVKQRDLENSDSARRPWEALGMSRTTWYRKGKPETGPAHETPRETGTADYIENLYPAVAVSPSARLVEGDAVIESAATPDQQREGGKGAPAAEAPQPRIEIDPSFLNWTAFQGAEVRSVGSQRESEPTGIRQQMIAFQMAVRASPGVGWLVPARRGPIGGLTRRLGGTQARIGGPLAASVGLGGRTWPQMEPKRLVGRE
jgi:hypothetical protein